MLERKEASLLFWDIGQCMKQSSCLGKSLLEIKEGSYLFLDIGLCMQAFLLTGYADPLCLKERVLLFFLDFILCMQVFSGSH